MSWTAQGGAAKAGVPVLEHSTLFIAQPGDFEKTLLGLLKFDRRQGTDLATGRAARVALLQHDGQFGE